MEKGGEGGGEGSVEGSEGLGETEPAAHPPHEWCLCLVFHGERLFSE